MANGEDGIFIDGSPNNTIGGSNPADRNVISGNTLEGIFIQSAAGNLVQGNYIGLNAAATAALANAGFSNQAEGVDITAGPGTMIGGTGAGGGDVIRGNGGCLVVLVLPPLPGNPGPGDFR